MLNEETESKQWPLSNYVAAWAVHAFTMTGLLWVLLAARALMVGDYKMMWLWLGIALVVDGADGPMARKARVTEVVPWFSGAMMDNVIDYLTWTFVPAVFLANVLPLGPAPLPLVAAAMVLMSSMFCYANTKMKSTDWYFVGFPAAWNIVVIVLWLFSTPAWLNWLVIVTFTVLAVVPWKWVHPFRVKQFRGCNASAAAIWVVTTAALTALHPVTPLWLTIPWAVAGAWLLAAGAIRTWKGRPDHQS